MVKSLRARCVRLRFRVGAGVALLAGLAPTAAVAQWAPMDTARPALWVVNDADTTIYLFGTIHTHDGRARWFDHAIRRAFDAAGELVLETLIPPVGAKLETSPGSGLSAAKATIQSARTIGLSVELGADQVLNRAALAVGMPVFGLEDFSDQLRMYQSLPTPARPAVPAAAASQRLPDPRLAPFLRQMVDRWNQGDAGPIEAVVAGVRSQSPDAYRRLFSDRNMAWALWIGKRLERPGTVFVAVGTGHLVGSDSVQVRLAAAGIRSARIN